MAASNTLLSLLFSGKPGGKAAPGKKRKGSSRDDLRTAMRDFHGAKDDDARVTALLNFTELSQDYQRED